MKVAGYDYLTEQNNRIRSQLQNFDTAADQVQAINPVQSDVSSVNNQTQPSPDERPAGAALNISAEGSRAGQLADRPRQTSVLFAPTDFSTDTSDRQSDQSTVSGNAVLNQYRFFVQTTQYEGDDGVVKRIFRQP